jgi:TonB family protein
MQVGLRTKTINRSLLLPLAAVLVISANTLAQLRVAPEAFRASATRVVEPSYPRLAIDARVSGKVIVQLILDENGNPISARALSGHVLLKDAAVTASRHWRFRPFRSGGAPVGATSTIEFDFDLTRTTALVTRPDDHISPEWVQLNTTIPPREVRIIWPNSGYSGPVLLPYEGPFYRLTGRVIDDRTGGPVPRASVDLGQDPQHRTRADRRGRFTLGVPIFGANLIAGRNDYIEVWPFRRSADDPIRSHFVGPETVSITLRLAPAASISGAVRSADGTPLRNLEVTLERYSPSSGWPGVERTSVNTADNGSYRFDQLPPGRYRLEVLPDPDAPPIPDKDGRMSDLVAVHYPAPQQDGQIPFMRLDEGQQTRVDLLLPRKQLFHITGSTTGAGKMMPMVRVVDQSGSISPFLQMAPKCCQFEAWLPPGTYRLVSQYDVADGSSFTGSAVLQVVDSNVPGVVLPMEHSPRIDIPVQITNLAEAKMRGTVECNNWGPVCGFEDLELVPLDGGIKAPAFSLNSVVNKVHSGLGRKSLGAAPEPSIHVLPGTYVPSVRLSSQVNVYLQSMTIGDKDLIRKPLVVRPGDQPGPIRIVFAEGSIADGVTLRGSKPVRAWVYAIPEQPDITTLNEVLSNTDGTFRINGLAPTRYLFFASDVELNLDVHDSKVVEYWRQRGQTLSVRTGDHPRLELQVFPLKAGRPGAFYP